MKPSTLTELHAVARKSRWASAGNSVGVRMVSIFIYVARGSRRWRMEISLRQPRVLRAKAISISSACNEKDIAGRSRRAGRNAWRQSGAGVARWRGGAGNKAVAARVQSRHPRETRNQIRRRRAERSRQSSRPRRAVSSAPRAPRRSGNCRMRSRSNRPSAISRAAASRLGARKPILQARSSASVKAAMRCGVGKAM